MSLSDIINLKLDSISLTSKNLESICEDEAKSIKEISSDLLTIKEFLQLLGEDNNSIRDISTDAVVNVLVKEGYYTESSDINNQLRLIKILLKGIDNGLSVSLNERQSTMLNTFINNVNECKTSEESRLIKLKDEYNINTKNKNDLDEEIINYEILLEKIGNSSEFLTEEDFNLVYSISIDEMLPIDTRKELLIKFIEYNNSLNHAL